MLRICVMLLIAVLSALFVGSANAGPYLRYENGMLSLEAQEVPLRDILAALAGQGITAYLGDGLNPVISTRFDNRPVDEAFAGLLKGYDYSLIWREDADGGAVRLEEIRVFEPGRSEAVERVGSDGLAVVAGREGRLMIRDTVLIMAEKGVTRAGIASLVAPYAGVVADFDEQRGLALVRLPDGSDPEGVSARMGQSDLVRIAEPDYVYELPRAARIGGVPVPRSEPADPAVVESDALIAVLDSGVAEPYVDSGLLAGAYDAISASYRISDDSGHGTQMVLIAAGAVDPLGAAMQPRPSSPVLAVRIFDEHGYTSTSILKNAIDYAVRSQARVVSMSWGSETDSRVLESIVDYAADQGLILVAAAGNEATGLPVYPAAYDRVIGVGALMPGGEVWPQSNYGSFVEVEMPGLALFAEGGDEISGIYAGTSIAAAYAARRISAVLAATPDAGRDAVLGELSRD